MTRAAAMEEQPGPPNAPTDAAATGGTIFTPYRRTQFFVVIASIVCFLLFWWAGRARAIPQEKGFEASLLQQPNWLLDFVATYVLFGVCLIVGTLIAGWTWFFAGLFAANVGLIAFSARGGSIRYVLFRAASHGSAQGVYLTLALELCLLFIPVALAWVYFWRQYQRLLPLPKDAEAEHPDHSLPVFAVLAQIAITGALAMLLLATESKQQVLVSLFLSGLIGTALADYVAPHRKAPAWYWIGPLAVGLIGYVLAYMSATAWTNGGPLGALAPLARPLPLDYASAGAAGTLLGYWLAAERERVAFSTRRSSAVTEPTSSESAKDKA